MFFNTVAKIVEKYGLMFLQGAGTTLLIAITGTIIGFAIGLGIGIVRTVPVDAKSSPVKRVLLKIVNGILAVYIEIFRGTPMIVQAMVLFYGFAAATGISLDRILAGIVIVSINTGAYMAEIVRGGILSIDKGQFEAAHSIGMTHGQTMTNIILPQAIRNIMPATGNEFVINIKDTSVLMVISVTELFFKTSMVNANTYKTFETYFITCVLYLIMTFTVTRILRLIERRMDGPKTFTIHGSQTVPEAEIKITNSEEKKRWIR